MSLRKILRTTLSTANRLHHSLMDNLFNVRTGGHVNESEYVEMSLRQLRLRPGIALQTRCELQGMAKEEAQFLAAIDGKGIMVSHAGRTSLTVGH